MPATRERVRTHLDVNHATELLRPAAVTLAESFPADWRTATFQIELERTAEGPRVWLTAYEIHGKHRHEAGRTC
jgi:hypothetical protein